MSNNLGFVEFLSTIRVFLIWRIRENEIHPYFTNLAFRDLKLRLWDKEETFLDVY